MGHLLVVQGDPVRGTDRHHVEGEGTNPAPPPATVFYAGLGDYAYKGSLTEALSTFVTVAGTPLALVSSRSGLDPGEDKPGGGHVGPSGGNFTPAATTVAPTPLPGTLRITDTPLGTGVPNSAAGNALLTVAGVRVLLDGDPVDTCSGVGETAGSKVTAAGQDFVTCSG
ncbi:hypothetical protein [Streptomyces sp. NRRL B-3229]|uniref:hypothetical protein n=1 Tax=Streptomyces sp. NRRL B-3229 TaxID=1463836 RepID=UPI0004C04BC2|nr:hypothetical protein [Streptomyces sp. NRRL B-3229]